MNLASIKLFIDITQSRSFSRAAAGNGVSQSAASQQIQELERELNVVLLDRSTRPLVVTQAGRLYAEYCRDVLRRWDEFDAALEKHYGLDSRARTFFIVHGKVDQEHTAMAAETIARNANSDREKELVRAAAKNMVRFKLAKFEGIYDAYA